MNIVGELIIEKTQLDSLTRLTLQEELVSLWRREGFTAILVTHDVEEAVLLASRVIVLSGRPGRIKAEFKVERPYPRHRDDPALVGPCLGRADPLVRVERHLHVERDVPVRRVDHRVAARLEEMESQEEEIAYLAERLASGKPLTLLCSSACTDAAHCHRTLLKELIEQRVAQLPVAVPAAM